MPSSAKLRQSSCTGRRLSVPNAGVWDVLRASSRASLACFGTGVLLFASWPAVAQTQADEHRVKAAFLYHFAQLVNWPPQSLGTEDRTFIFCTVGEQTVPDALESTVEGKQIGTHPIKVQHLRENDDLRSCHMLYILLLDKKQVAAILARLQNASILTVGESDNFIQQGGMIGFALLDKKVRFDINLQSAQRANLKISSRLLLLAKIVVGDPGQG